MLFWFEPGEKDDWMRIRAAVENPKGMPEIAYYTSTELLDYFVLTYEGYCLGYLHTFDNYFYMKSW